MVRYYFLALKTKKKFLDNSNRQIFQKVSLMIGLLENRIFRDTKSSPARMSQCRERMSRDECREKKNL